MSILGIAVGERLDYRRKVIHYLLDMDIQSFFKNLKIPEFSIPFFGASRRVVGIDIGVYSVKVVELEADRGRAVLATYGELLASTYLKEGGGGGG